MMPRKSIDTVMFSVAADKLSQREWDWIKLMKPMAEPTQDTAVVVKRNRAQGKPEPNPAEPKKPRTPRSIPVSDAYAQLTPFWPALFDRENVRLMKINVLQDLIRDKDRRGISLSNKMLKRSVKAISRSPAYLERVAIGQIRFDIEGNAS